MKQLLLVPILMCAAVLAICQDSDRDSDLAIKIRSLENSKFAAEKHQDVGALSQILDDRLVVIDPDGAMLNEAQFLSVTHDADITVLLKAPETMTVRVSGDVVTVVGIYVERELKNGRLYSRRCRFIDTWALKSGRWLCIASVATSTIQ